MEFRDLHYNRHGSIDCEINHPKFGWIPFTASSADPDPSSAGIYAAIMESDEPIAPYVPVPEPAPDRVSSRQFKMALHAAGLLETVQIWTDAQDPLLRIAFDNSTMFVRSEPMMQQGFAALGLSVEEIDAFFVSAAAI